MNYQANQIYIKTGAPSQPTDTRTADEKLQDIYRLRSDVRTLLREIMTGEDANIVAERLNENEIRFLAQQANIIFPELKKSYRLGITSDIFFQYFREYMRKFQETSGVAIEEMRQFVKDHLPTKQQLQEFRQVVNNIMDLHNQIQEQSPGEYINLGNYAELFIDNLNGLEEIIDDITKNITDATRIKNAIIRNDILSTINDIVREVPTRQQISVIIQNLNIGYNARDPDFIIEMFRYALELIEFSDNVQQDLELLNNRLQEANFELNKIPIQNFPEGRHKRDLIPVPTREQVRKEVRKERVRQTRDEVESLVNDAITNALLNLNIPQIQEEEAPFREAPFREAPFQEERQFTQEELEAMNEPYNPEINPMRPPIGKQGVPNIVDRVNYSYIGSDNLKLLNKTARKDSGTANLVDYISALKRVEEDNSGTQEVMKRLGFSDINIVRSKNMTKERIIEILNNNDEDISSIWNTYQERQPRLKKGKGVLTNSVKTSRIRGRGLKTTKPVDFTAGIMSEPDYVPFGKYIINRKRLCDGVCMIKRINGKFMPDMKTKRISPNLTAVFRKVAGGSLPNFSELEKLDDDEREYLKHISKKCNLSSRLEVPSPKKDKTETLVNQFEIMRGQLIAGNDSKDLIKNFKKILIEMLEKDLLPKGQAKDILIDLARME